MEIKRNFVMENILKKKWRLGAIYMQDAIDKMLYRQPDENQKFFYLILKFKKAVKIVFFFFDIVRVDTSMVPRMF